MRDSSRQPRSDMAIAELPLKIDVRTNGARSIRIALSGDLDLATAPAFAGELAEACAAHPSHIVLDFTDLTFCDSSGVRVCIGGSQRCDASGVTLHIHGANDRVRKVFDLLGLHE